MEVAGHFFKNVEIKSTSFSESPGSISPRRVRKCEVRGEFIETSRNCVHLVFSGYTWCHHPRRGIETFVVTKGMHGGFAALAAEPPCMPRRRGDLCQQPWDLFSLILRRIDPRVKFSSVRVYLHILVFVCRPVETFMKFV